MDGHAQRGAVGLNPRVGLGRGTRRCLRVQVCSGEGRSVYSERPRRSAALRRLLDQKRLHGAARAELWIRYRESVHMATSASVRVPAGDGAMETLGESPVWVG